MDVEELVCSLSLELLYKIASALTHNPTGDVVQTAWLSSAHYFIFLKTGAMKDLQQAILGTKGAVAATHIFDPDRARFLKFLIRMQGKKYENTKSLKDLQIVMDGAVEMVTTLPINHPDGGSQFIVDLHHLITMMFKKYKHIKSESEAPPDLHIDRAGILSDVATALSTMLDRTGSLDYLHLSIERRKEAVDATPKYRHLDRELRLTILAATLVTRFKVTHNPEDLEEAIRRNEEALASTFDGDPQRGLILNTLACSLAIRFKNTSKFDDLENAIRRAKEAVDATPEKSDERGMMLSNLGAALAIRFEQTGCPGDLQDAIDSDVEALACTKNKQKRSLKLSNLATNLLLRFKQIGNFEDLQEAIRRSEEAVGATPHGDRNRQLRLGNLANGLGTRFDQTGSLDDLQRCIDVEEEAVACTPDDNWDVAIRLRSLAQYYGMRFSRTMDTDNLHEAIRRSREAVARAPPDHADRAYLFNTLGQNLRLRFARTGDPKDLFESVRVNGEAVDATLANHPDRGLLLKNWADTLRQSFKLTGNPDDLKMAIKKSEESLAATTSNHINRMGLLHGLATSLWLSFEQTGDTNDMERAIDTAEEALTAAPPDPDRLARRGNMQLELAGYLKKKSECHGDPGDYERSLRLFVECVEMRNAEPRLRIIAAIQAVEMLSRDHKWVELSRIADIAVNLLPTVSPRALKQSDQQYTVGQFTGLASWAASAALQADKEACHALELLELGRGIIAGLRFEAWTDLTALREQHREMADKFEWLRGKLDSPSSSGLVSVAAGDTPTSHSKISQRHNDSHNFEKLVDEIRHLPNFKHFLLPPQKDELKAVASPGPVVLINVTSLRCDAFLLDGTDEVRLLPLPLLNYSDILENANLLKLIRRGQAPSPRDQMSRMLAWLWDVAAGPILDELGFRKPPSDSKWPHVWWIPTGLLSSLPLHAAGRHSSESSEAVLDRVVSSYSPSIKALLHARQNSEQKILNRTFDHVLLVSMETTPGRSDLQFAAKEVQVLSDLLSASTPEVKKPPQLNQPCREAVLASLNTCTVFHFAGHGRSDPLDPSKSSLLLADWQRNPFTVEDLIGLNLHQRSPWLAYLSACSTGENQVESLQDEAIHLVTACQLSGFQHVVGSLWEVSDRYSVDAAGHFYKALKHGGVMNDGAIAWAAHNAARFLREDTRNPRRNPSLRRLRQGRPQEEDVEDEIEGLSDPLIWAAYVHVGP